jgi:ferredoxin
MSDESDAADGAARKPRKPREKLVSSYNIEVIRKRCTAVGTCMEEASRTFDMDDEAVAFVSNPNGNTDAEVLAAAKSCPVDAIFLYDKATGEKVWPPRDKRFEKDEA